MVCEALSFEHRQLDQDNSISTELIPSQPLQRGWWNLLPRWGRFQWQPSWNCLLRNPLSWGNRTVGPNHDIPLPSTGQACVFSDGFVYCVGGATSGGRSPSCTNAIYFAPVSDSGMGTWKEGRDYPLSVETTCALTSRRLYCMGGYDGNSEGEDNNVCYASLLSVSG